MALIRDKYMRIESRAKRWETVVEIIKAEFMSLVQKEMKVTLMVDVFSSKHGAYLLYYF